MRPKHRIDTNDAAAPGSLRYQVASDVWSVGATICELLTGSPPYFHLQSMPAMFRIVQVNAWSRPAASCPHSAKSRLACPQVSAMAAALRASPFRHAIARYSVLAVPCQGLGRLCWFDAPERRGAVPSCAVLRHTGRPRAAARRHLGVAARVPAVVLQEESAPKSAGAPFPLSHPRTDARCMHTHTDTHTHTHTQTHTHTHTRAS